MVYVDSEADYKRATDYERAACEARAILEVRKAGRQVTWNGFYQGTLLNTKVLAECLRDIHQSGTGNVRHSGW